MGSHEVSEALVSKRATREAEREERGVSQRGAQSRRGGRPATQHPGQEARAGDEPAVGGIVPGDVATAITARSGTAGQRKRASEESGACLRGLRGKAVAPPPGSPQGQRPSSASEHSLSLGWQLPQSLTQKGKGN